MPTSRPVLAILIVLLVSLASVPALRAQQDEAMTKDQGTFAGADGHKASGAVHLVASGTGHLLHFTPDFSVERGPDVYVTLTDSTRRVTSQSLVVGKLTRFSGEQTHDLPAGAELGRYTHVVLWCKKYDVRMGEAALARAEAMGGR